MSTLTDFLTAKDTTKTQVGASFELQASEPSADIATVPASTKADPGPKKKFRRVGKRANKPKQSAQGKKLTVVGSSKPAPKPVAKSSLMSRLKAKGFKPKAVAPAPKPVAKSSLMSRLKAKVQPKTSTAKPVAKKTPIRSFLRKPAVKKTATVAAVVAAPVAAGAYLAIKNRKAIASTAKNVVNKLPKIKLRRRR